MSTDELRSSVKAVSSVGPNNMQPFITGQHSTGEPSGSSNSSVHVPWCLCGNCRLHDDPHMNISCGQRPCITSVPASPCCQFINQVRLRSIVNIYVNPLLFRLFMLDKSVFVPGLFIQEKFGSKQGPKWHKMYMKILVPGRDPAGFKSHYPVPPYNRRVQCSTLRSFHTAGKNIKDLSP